jgi:hypothetical protein
MSREIEKWRTFVRSFGCMICAHAPCQIHHPRGGSVRGEAGGSLKSAEAGIIPLCPHHHTGAAGIHTVGVETWEATHGTQRHHRERLALMIEKWERDSGLKAPRLTLVEKPSKILPRR